MLPLYLLRIISDLTVMSLRYQYAIKGKNITRESLARLKPET